ncbi:STAS domain-containing protein [Cytobacillus depressus]|uniref:STAS domain-containing protein n=1 Tax=Cytobacillus depressus TaxID=1602942 RepID=A0A6L3V4T1_9BACI|nr:SulP family inorganic anion transporter [Cytobacillus depressus]KAB2333349.1 STAS domain-containing protein [Cytobacillus depressus]
MKQEKWFFTGRFKGYSIEGFQKDLLSGLIVGVIAIPLGMAFAIASGVKPEYGIYTTIIAGILIALCGGSKYQIGGPTGAFIPILFGIVITYGYENLLISGFLAGGILFLMGVLRLGALIRFIPKPVTIGFTSGIAVIIFTGQIANFLGLQHVKQHEFFHQNIIELFSRIQTLNLFSLLTAGICLLFILFTPKLFPKVPGPIIGLLISSIIAAIFYPGEVATIGSTYGDIPSTLPRFSWPQITFEKVIQLIGPAFVIAMLGAIESLLSSVVADGMTNSKHHSNRELVGQGIANMVTPLFGGIPATGAIARTATNIKNGAVSPISGIVHGIMVLLILLLFAPYASSIPLASMAPILMVVAWNMSEKHRFYYILKTRTADSLVLTITFFLTVFINLTVAVGVGLLLAIVLFTKNMSQLIVTAKALPDPKDKHKKIKANMVTDTHDCPQIYIYNVEGPLFFGAAQAFSQSIMNTTTDKPEVLLLRLSGVPFMDTTGEASLARMIKEFSKHGTVLISGVKPQPKKMLKKTGLYDVIGEEYFFEHTGEAIDFALKNVNKAKCLGCKHFAFSECTVLSGSKPVPGEKELSS